MACRHKNTTPKPRLHPATLRRLGGICLFILPLFPACNKSVEPQQNTARIIIDETIDGVLIGDDSAAVVQKLGPPSSITFPRTSGWLFAYDSGAHAGMSIAITNHTRSTRLSVTSMSASAPYPGTTADGIGIGVDQALILSRLGNPTDTLPTLSGLLVRYFYSNTTFNIGYTNDTVTSLAIVVKN
jgi:hypothetical protein